MKIHTTNYINGFIEIADDCPVKAGEMPPVKGDKKTVANYQFDMLYDHPYKYTSDDLLFTIHALRNDIPKSQWKEARAEFFSKGQPCLRASPLTKRYGWGIHSDKDGKIAMYGSETAEYKKLLKDKTLQVVKAMKSSR